MQICGLLEPDLVKKAVSELREILREKRTSDRFRGHTTVGPHRDDLEVFLDDKEMRKFASQGQKRTALLALKLAEIDSVVAERGAVPILLIDDISSELDQGRMKQLFEKLASYGGQVFMSSTGFGGIETSLPQKDFKRFQVEKGSVSEI